MGLTRSRLSVVSLATAGVLLGTTCVAVGAPTRAVAPQAAAVVTAAAPTATVTNPQLVAIRAAAHKGFDRVVFEFQGGMPTRREVKYVTQLIQDGSGDKLPIAGRAILQVTMFPTDAHNDKGQPTVFADRAFNLPNVMVVKRAGDFEAVTTYGIGLARRTSFSTFTLKNPNRLVVDITTNFSKVTKKVWFFNQKRFLAATEPYFTPVNRSVPATMPATGSLDRLYAGPTPTEYASGLRLLASQSTGFSNLSISRRTAHVRLTGGCTSGGSTVTVAGSIMPTLRQLSNVDWVKVYYPAHQTGDRRPGHDSIPGCLEP